MALFGTILKTLFRPVTKFFSWTMRKMGESFLSVSQKLSQGDISYDQVQMARDIRQSLTEIDFYRELYKDLDRFSPIPKNFMVETTLNRPYFYRTAFEVTLKNIDSGELKTFIASVYHDDNLNYHELRQSYWDEVMKVGESENVSDLKYYDWVIQDFKILTVWHDSASQY